MKNSMRLILLSVISSLALNGEVLLFSTAYQLALKNAHSIKASRYKVNSAKERLVQEKSRLYPQINLSGYYKKSEYNYYDSKKKALKQGLFNYGVTFKQSLYNAEIYSKIAVERSRNELFEVGINLEKEQLAQTVFIAYLEVLKSNNRIKLYKSYLKYSKSKLDELNIKYEKFMVSKMDLLEMKVSYKSAKIDLIKEKKIFIVNELKLRQLLGNVEYELPSINSDISILPSIKKMKESVVNKNNFSTNLALLQAKLELKVSQEEAENAFDGHYPRLNLEGSIYGFDTDDPDVQAPYKNTKNVMLVLNIPIYSGGATSSRVRESELKSKSVNEKLLDTQNQIRVQYDEYIALFEASAESVSMYKDAYESALLYVDAIEKGYKHGIKSIIDVNDAKTKQYEVKYKYIENIYEMVDSYIGLLIVTNNFESIELLDKLVK